MSDEVFHIRSPRPLLWRTPTSLQVGVDHPVIALSDIPDEAAPLIHALQSGVSKDGYRLLAKQLKIPPQDAMAIVDGLTPAFDEDEQPPRPRLVVTGTSVARVIVAETLSQWGFDVSLSSSPDPNRLDVVHLLTCDYLADPTWLSRYGSGRSPHLPLVFSDQSVTAGPLIVPGETPCLSCRELFLRDGDPNWLSLGSQLWGQVAPSATEDFARLGGVLVSVALGQLRLDNASENPQPIVRYRTTDRTVSFSQATFHPDCRCRGL